MKRTVCALLLLLAAALPAAALDEDFLKAIRTAPGRETLARLADEALRDYPPEEAQTYLLYIESRRNAVIVADFSQRFDRLAKELGDRIEESNNRIRDLRDDLVRRPLWLDDRFDRFHRRMDDLNRQLGDMTRQLGDMNRQVGDVSRELSRTHR